MEKKKTQEQHLKREWGEECTPGQFCRKKKAAHPRLSFLLQKGRKWSWGKGEERQAAARSKGLNGPNRITTKTAPRGGSTDPQVISTTVHKGYGRCHRVTIDSRGVFPHLGTKNGTVAFRTGKSSSVELASGMRCRQKEKWSNLQDGKTTAKGEVGVKNLSF